MLSLSLLLKLVCGWMHASHITRETKPNGCDNQSSWLTSANIQAISEICHAEFSFPKNSIGCGCDRDNARPIRLETLRGKLIQFLFSSTDTIRFLQRSHCTFNWIRAFFSMDSINGSLAAQARSWLQKYFEIDSVDKRKRVENKMCSSIQLSCDD